MVDKKELYIPNHFNNFYVTKDVLPTYSVLAIVFVNGY